MQVPRRESTQDALAGTLARAVAARARAAGGRGGRALLQRDINLVGPYSQQTPESVWNEYQRGTMALTEWEQSKRKFDEWRPPNPELVKRGLKGRPRPPDPGPKPAPPNTPWLGVYDVYAGVTETGNSSWPQLVRQRFAAKGSARATKFTVFTGMHGNIGGQFLDQQGRIDDAYKDSKHTQEDLDSRDTLRGEGIDVTVIDVFKGEKLRKPAKLAAKVKAEVATGRVVILAWCFSVEAFKSVPSGIVPDVKGDPTPDTPEKLYAAARRRLTVQNIVSDVFGPDLIGGFMRPNSIVPALLEHVDAIRDALDRGADEQTMAPILGDAARLWRALDEKGRTSARLALTTALSRLYTKLPTPKPPSKPAMAAGYGFDGLF